MLILGEIQTCFLHHSTALSREEVEELLTFLPGQRITSTERPVQRAVSPAVPFGVDCQMATMTATKAVGVGTALSRLVVTGGLLLQGSSYVHLEKAPSDRRLPWSHYMDRLGTVEVRSRATTEDLGEGFLHKQPTLTALDLASINEHLVSRLQRHPDLDRKTTIPMRTVRLKWSARVVRKVDPSGHIRINPHDSHTVRLEISPEHTKDVTHFCEEFALHDWLSTTLAYLLELVHRGGTPKATPVELLAAATTKLLPHWMPGAHTASNLDAFWENLERRPALTKQWALLEHRVRDEISLRILKILSARS